MIRSKLAVEATSAADRVKLPNRRSQLAALPDDAPPEEIGARTTATSVGVVHQLGIARRLPTMPLWPKLCRSIGRVIAKVAGTCSVFMSDPGKIVARSPKAASPTT
mmetsp:Transcript_64765/g.128049  ORF Transcript_64765/g.128049 Transcript_64765/m.128049 type:complete len:106 (-) Transcript_64765:14-331(-)